MKKKSGPLYVDPEWKCVDDQPDGNRGSHYSRFALSPLSIDQAMTFGVAIRRALLSEVETISIVSANVVGAVHEYSTLDGVRESIDEILLNLKKIGIRENQKTLRSASSFNPWRGDKKQYRASIFAQGPGIVTAEHIKFPSFLVAVDPDQLIATLLNETQLCIELSIQQGILDKIDISNKKLSGFLLDTIFPPVQKANFSIHSLGDSKGFDQILLLEIWTNKSLTPTDALYQAHASLFHMFSKIQPPAPSYKIVKLDSEKSPSIRTTLDLEYRKALDTKNIAQLNNKLTDKKIEDLNRDTSRAPRNLTRDLNNLISLKPDSNPSTGLITPNDPGGTFLRVKPSLSEKVSIRRELPENFPKENLLIEDLEFSPRISNCLKKANICTVEDLLNCTKEDLLTIKNFGQKSVEQVSLVLRQRFNLDLLSTN